MGDLLLHCQKREMLLGERRMDEEQFYVGPVVGNMQNC